MADSRIPPQVEAWSALLIFQARLLRRVEREFERRGLVSFTIYDVLLQLRRAPDRALRFRELNGEVVLSRSALSRCVDRMTALGLVDKEECPEDPRGVVVRLRQEGWTALKAAWPVYRQEIVAAFGNHFDAEELRCLADRFGVVNGQES
jgi:DNA-binding MarR family transcriptional regulator